MNVHARAAGRGLQLAGVAMLALAGVLVTVAGTPAPALAVSGPSATVAPSSGLTDGQTVTVSGSGFPADHAIQIEECAGTVDNPPPDNTSCDGVTLDSSTDTDDQGGYLNSGYTVYTRPSSVLASPATITCDAGHACVLYVGVDQNNFSAAHAFAALTFSDSVTTTTTAPPATTTSTTDPPASTSTTSTTAKSTTSTTSRRSTTTTTACGRQAQSREPSNGGCTTPTTLKLSTATTVGPGITSGGLSGTATTTTTGGPDLTGATSPSDTTATTTGPSLHDSGGGDGAGLGTDGPTPDPAPALPLTGVPRAAGLLAVGGVAIVLGGTELRRRLLRPGSDGAR